MHCSLFIHSKTWSQRLGLRYTFHKRSMSWVCGEKREIVAKNLPLHFLRHKGGPRRLNLLLWTCVLINASFDIHKWMWAMLPDCPLKYSHVLNPCLRLFRPLNPKDDAERQPCGWRRSSGSKPQGNCASRCSAAHQRGGAGILLGFFMQDKPCERTAKLEW